MTSVPSPSPPRSAPARRRRRLLVIVAAALGLAAAACGDSSTAQDEAGGVVADDATVLDAAVFDGTATTVGGETYDLGQLADADLVLWFWAPW